MGTTSLQLLNNHRHLFNTTTTAPRFLNFLRRNAAVSIPIYTTPNLSICCYSKPDQVGANHHSTSPFRSQPDDEDDAVFMWNPADPQSVIANGGENVNTTTTTTVVLIGWLGAKTKQLKSYVKWYNSRGVNAITFVVEASEPLTYELGPKFDRRMSLFADELASRVLSAEKEEGEDEDGRECYRLFFHTFSNTGWLVYGSILDDFQSRHQWTVMQKIKGCIVDSGGGGPFSSQVWAAGFAAAALPQKRGGASAANPRNAGVVLQPEKKPPQIAKIISLFLFEKLFSILLNLPRLNQSLKRWTSILKEKQAFPQLYLYSTGDEVIPFKAVESFMEEQRKMGRIVISYNFGPSSNHLHHYWNFRSKYSSLLSDFLQQCLATETDHV